MKRIKRRRPKIKKKKQKVKCPRCAPHDFIPGPYLQSVGGDKVKCPKCDSTFIQTRKGKVYIVKKGSNVT